MATETMNSTRAALVSAIGAERVRDATEQDTVDGVLPRWVASAESTEGAAAVMRTAAEHGLRIVPRGAGSKVNWGNPPEAVDLVLDMAGADAVLEHAAGDLVLRAKAGTPIAEIQRVVRAAGQQLAIDQPLPEATVGGVIAADTAGPGRHLFGGVRDLLIGITVVRADGAVTISGGKVVKNVAGYDLGKLYTGSYGTLGVITEAVFRLHPLAGEHRWVSVSTDNAKAAADVVAAIRSSQAMPTAIEVDRTDPLGPITVCTQLEGRSSVTDTRARELADLLAGEGRGQPVTSDAAPAWWGEYPFDTRTGVGLRLGTAPAELFTLLTEAQRVSERCGVPLALRGAAGLGVLHAGLPADTDPAAAAEVIESLRGAAEYVVLMCGPREIRTAVNASGPIDTAALMLMQRIKAQFDPEHRLAPGRFVGGI